MAILITGGLGYIGSHIAKLAREKVVIIDNQSNSNLKYKSILPKSKVIINDLNYNSASNIFKNNKISCVIHLAGFKSVIDSIKNPISYYKNNVLSSIELLNAMLDYGVNKIIFSSSATVYGNNNESPLLESFKTSYINPYGHTKIIFEEILKECSDKYKNFRAISLRYFNPIGAHPSGLLAESPLGKPTNLMPLIIKNVKERKILKIFGNNYNTKDGTCIRDFIHVLDLASAHLSCLKIIRKIKYENINIGLGKGITVLDLIKIFEKTNNMQIKYKFTKRRDGDSPISFADNKKALSLLNWRPYFSYEDMCRHSWKSAI